MKRTQFFTRKMFVGCITTACLLFGVNAFAQQGAGKGGGRPPAGDPPIERLDSNQDGQLSQEEFLAEFSRLDQNQDGKIEANETPPGPRGPQEQQKGRSDERPERGPQAQGEGRQGDRGERAEGRGERPQDGPREGFIEHFDQNDDGTVSQDEFLEDFNRLDQDQNGVIDESERPQGPPQGAPPAE